MAKSILFRASNHSRPRFILASLAAALVPMLSFGQVGTGGALRVWAGAGNGNFQNNPNWLGGASGAPDISDGEAGTTGSFQPAGTDAILFPDIGTLSAAGQANLTINLNAPGSNNAGTTIYTLRAILFDPGAGAYTFNSSNNRIFVLGDSTDTLVNPQNTGSIINNSLSTQTFNVPVRFRFGTIDAAAGQIIFNGAVNIGNDLVDAVNNVIIDGSSEVAGQSVVTINGPLTGLGTDTTDGGAIIKNGTGTLVLNGNNSAWNGRIHINDGAVQIGSGNALGSADGRTTVAGGFATGHVRLHTSSPNVVTVAEPLHFEGRALANAPHVVNTAGSFSITGDLKLQAGGTEFGFRSDAGDLTIAGNLIYDTASSPTNLRLSGAGNGEVSSEIGALPLSVIKEGNGTWTLSGTTAYTGATEVNAGRLNITTAHTGGGDLTLGDAATLGITLGAVDQTLQTSTFTLGSTTGGTLEIDLGSLGGFSTPVITAGTLETYGTNTITIKGTGLSVGSVPLIAYTGAIGGDGFESFSLAGLPPRVQASLTNTGLQVALDITSFDFPKWTGLAGGTPNGFWNINNGADPTTGTGNANWKEANSGAITRYLQIAGGAVDSVLFDDSAAGTTGVNLTTTLTPTTATVNNSALTYTFLGLGKLSGATSLIKQGDGTLIIANTGGNDYTGTTTISSGTVQIGDGVTFGGGQFGTGPVVNDASIVLLRPDAENFTFSANISGTGTLTKQGLNVATISGANTFDGTVIVSAGTLKLGSTTALGSDVGGTFVEPGATLDLGDFLVPLGEVVTISGDGAGLTPIGALINSGPVGVAGSGIHNLALAGDASIGGGRRFDVRDGELSGGGFTLTKIGTNSIHLANLGETHLGSIVLDLGRLSFEGSTTFGDQAGSLQIAATGELGFENSTAVQTKPVHVDGGKVIFNAGTANELAGPVTLAPSVTNTFQGPLNAATIATLTISGPVSGDGELTKTQAGTLVLSGTNSYTGGTGISAGAVHFLDAASVPTTGTIALAGGSTVGFGFEFDQAFLASRVAATPNPATIALGVNNAKDFDFAAYPGAGLGAFADVTYSGTITPFSTLSAGGYRLGGGGGTLTYTGVLSGANTLEIGNTGSAGTVVLTNANTYVGRTTIAAGSTLILGNAAALSAPSNPLTVSGMLDLNGFDVTVGSLTATNTALVTDNSATPGTTIFTTNQLSGSSTFAGGIIDGANGRSLTFVKAGGGTLVFNRANGHTYSGGTYISGGRLELRTNNAQILLAGSALTFTGNGTFAATNNGNGNPTLTLGTLTFAAGEGTVESNNFSGTAAGGTVVFSVPPARLPGATGNFTLVGTTAPQTFKVVFSTPPPTGQSIDGGVYFGGSDFAAYHASGGGYVRALNYANDANAFDTALTADQPDFGPVVTDKDVQVSGATFAITNQGTESLRTLRIAGANNITLATEATLTLTTGGLIKAGGNAAVISAGEGLTTGGATDLVIRTAAAADTLTIETPIPSSQEGGLTKAGPGALILSGLNEFTGGVWVNAGSLRFSSAEAVPATGDIRLNVNTTVSFAHSFDQEFLAARVPANLNPATIALGVDNPNDLDFSAAGLNYSGFSLGAVGAVAYSGTLTPFGNTYRLGGGGGTLTVAKPLTGENSLIIGSGGSSGVVVLATPNSYTGGTTLTAGTLRLGDANALGSRTGTITLTAGTLDLQTFDQTLTNLSGGNATITDNSSVAGTTTVVADIVSGTNTFSGTVRNGNSGRVLRLVKDGAGALTLSKANGHTYTGGTELRNGRLEIRTNNAQVLPLNSDVTITGSSTFAAANNGAASVTTAGLTLGRLFLNAGDAVIESNQLSASTTHTLTFNEVPTRAPGATGNFTLTVATDPALYRVVFATAPNTGESLGGGLYHGYSSFLAYDAAGYARPLNYATDGNATAVALAADQPNLGTDLSGRDVELTAAGFSITEQGTETLRSFKVAGPASVSLLDGETFTVTGGGFIKSGGGTASFSGGILTTGSEADFVFNIDKLEDTLNVSAAIAAGGLTKTGLGTLALDGEGTITGGVWLNNGVTLVNGSLSGAAGVDVNRGATLGGLGTLITSDDVTLASGGSLAPGASAGTLTLELGTGQLDLSAAADSGETGYLKFELGLTSDQVALASGTLNIGSGFDLSAFDFSNPGGFGEGTYVLFDTAGDIIGSFGPNAIGTVLGFAASLEFANGVNGRDDIVLVVIPEPNAAMTLLGGLGMLVGLRRRRR